MNNSKLILASSSPYRQKLLQRLNLAFKSISPDIDETPLDDEKAMTYVERMAKQKAFKIAKSFQSAWVIGADQTALFNENIIGKPGNHTSAVKQLNQFSGNLVQFITGVALVRQTSDQSIEQFYLTSTTDVYFKKLSPLLIEHYLQTEKPYNCAGSFKIESMGPILFNRVISDDPTSLEGLPLIALCKLFSLAKIDIFNFDDN
ncbi:Maf family protein [Aliikangiella maris]|uniref:Maf family protein n=2 Tax=Aliikangiella maris TaxID=3162458 RepID=A0ABV3MM09_9GAMM